MQATLLTWVLVVFGVVTLVPLFLAQTAMLFRPDDPRTRELLIGKGEDWRDRTHFRFSVGAACADWLFFVPIFAAGSLGVILGQPWGYALFGAAGACSVYINTILWFTEKDYVFPTRGPLRYYTYYWGFFMYWGASALIYSIFRFATASL